MQLPADLFSDDLAAKMTRWVERGWHVFPLAPRSKEPLAGSRGVKDATQDLDTIAAWSTKYPDANIGGSCAGRMVVDIDPRNGGETPDWLPTTRTHMSGRGDGGRHLVYWLPPDADVKSGKLATGVDIKTGPGSYVVLPGSVHPDTGWLYVEDDHPMVPAPPALVSRFARDGSGTPAGDSGTGVVRSLLSSLLENPARSGGRNDWMTAVCGHYAKRHRREPDLYWLHIRWSNEKLSPPLSEDELNKTATSIWESEQTNNPDRDLVDALTPDNGYLIEVDQRLMTLGWPDGSPRDAPAELVEFADFYPRVTSVILDPDDGMYFYDIELHRSSGPPVVTTIASEAFGDPRALRKLLARFAASVTHPKRLAHPTPDWSTRLLKFVTNQPAPHLNKASFLGWDDNERGYLTMDGVLDADGVRGYRVTKPNTVELRQSTPIDHRYGFANTAAYARQVLEQVCTYQDSDVVAVFGAWWAASLVKHVIRRHTAMFPVMAIEAASGSGKTSGFFGLMVQLIGSNDGAGQYTLATLRNALSANSNSIVWVDDLDDPSTIHEMVRVLTAGGSLSKMVNHTRTIRYPLVSSLLLSGESLALHDQKATLDRCILLHPPDPTRRRSIHGDYPQWDDITRLTAELHALGGGSALAGHFAQMSAEVMEDITQVCEVLSREVPSGRVGSWYLTLSVGARMLDYLITGDPSVLHDGDGEHTLAVHAWLDRQLESVVDDLGTERTLIRNDNTLTQNILPMFLSEMPLNPLHRSRIASMYQHNDGSYEVVFNTRALAQWWYDNRRGRVQQRTETNSSFQQQVAALRNAYPGHVEHTKQRVGAENRSQRYVRLTGPIAHEIVLRAQD